MHAKNLTKPQTPDSMQSVGHKLPNIPGTAAQLRLETPPTFTGIRTLLAPDITEAILEGAQPIDLNLDRLINLSLPIDWAEQRSVLGFK